MGIIDRATGDHMAQIALEDALLQAQHARDVEAASQRIAVIRQHLQSVAESLGEKFEEIVTTANLSDHYQIGDIVVMVRRFAYGNKLPDPTRPLLVTRDNCVYLACLNSDSRLCYLKVGTLTYLSYEGIAKVITSAPFGYAFEADKIRLLDLP